MNLRANLLANIVGQGWRALMGVLFIPAYIRYLGIESYGLVGIFAILQAWLGLVEMGVRPTLGREMAKFTAGSHTTTSIRVLLRSIEFVAMAIGIAAAIGIWFASNYLAKDWLRIELVAPRTASRAISLMGVVIALRLMENVYISAIVGLQHQVLYNVVTGVMATVRAVGAIAMLRWVSPTIDCYFVWQGLISLLTASALAVVVHRSLPPALNAVGFSWRALCEVRRFATGIMTITFLSLLLTQMDKALLSRLLPLQDFSYYAVASVLAGALVAIAAPVSTAYYPRFTELATQARTDLLRVAYHQAAQILTVLVGPAAIILVMFSDWILLIWTGDPALTARVSGLLPVLSLGVLFNCLMTTPYLLQLAYGWTRLVICISFTAVLILVPAIVLLVPRFGAIGAAWCGVALNASYLIFDVYMMHRRLLQTERLNWYLRDVGIPLVVAGIVALSIRLLVPSHLTRPEQAGAIFLAYVMSALAAVLAAPIVRSIVGRQSEIAWQALLANRR